MQANQVWKYIYMEFAQNHYKEGCQNLKQQQLQHCCIHTFIFTVRVCVTCEIKIHSCLSRKSNKKIRMGGGGVRGSVKMN